MTDDEIIKAVQPHTMLNEARLRNVLWAVERTVFNQTPGDLIEIGVWRGGCVMAMLHKLLSLGESERTVHLYDTFTGMTKPSSLDKHECYPAFDGHDPCFCPMGEVIDNVDSVGYPKDHVWFHKGDICELTPEWVPQKIALLRLDTDWYESTKYELDHFEHHVVPGGIVIVDDYGFWDGCRKATLEWLWNNHRDLRPIDDTGVFWIKP